MWIKYQEHLYENQGPKYQKKNPPKEYPIVLLCSCPPKFKMNPLIPRTISPIFKYPKNPIPSQTINSQNAQCPIAQSPNSVKTFQHINQAKYIYKIKTTAETIYQTEDKN